jgi:hypothetical protein
LLKHTILTLNFLPFLKGELKRDFSFLGVQDALTYFLFSMSNYFLLLASRLKQEAGAKNNFCVFAFQLLRFCDQKTALSSGLIRPKIGLTARELKS